MSTRYASRTRSNGVGRGSEFVVRLPFLAEPPSPPQPEPVDLTALSNLLVKLDVG